MKNLEIYVHTADNGETRLTAITEELTVEDLLLQALPNEHTGFDLFVEDQDKPKERHRKLGECGIKQHGHVHCRRRPIHYLVDDEPQQTFKRELTPTEIMCAAGVDPETHYLIQLREGEEPKSYKNEPTAVIPMHQKMRFITASLRPTPVSQSPMGRDDFIGQLRSLGYDSEERENNFVVFRFQVQVGRFAGCDIKIGLQINGDIALNPPPGPHVSPPLLPNNSSSNAHPGGGVHPSPLGSDWQYWSRPFSDWTKSDRSARAYMAHITALFDSQ